MRRRKGIIIELLDTDSMDTIHHENTLDLLKPHFYIVKLGFTGVYIIFLFCS